MRELHQLVRYAPVVRLVREVGPGTLLDVGSGGIVVAEHLGPGWRATLLEAEVSDEIRVRAEAARCRVVEGDARQLPFEDRSIDVAIAIDLLEHIVPDERGVVLAELARVARRRVIVASPVGVGARRADAALARAIAASGQPYPDWLREHLEYGVPDIADLSGPLSAAGTVKVYGNTNSRAHEMIMRSMLTRWGWHTQRVLAQTCKSAVRPSGTASRLASWTLRAVRGLDRDPIYRAIVVVDRT